MIGCVAVQAQIMLKRSLWMCGVANDARPIGATGYDRAVTPMNAVLRLPKSVRKG